MKKNSKNNYQKNQRNRLRLLISNPLSIVDKRELIDNYRSVSIFLTTLPWSQNLGIKGAPVIIVALFKSNAKQRDIPPLKLELYAILGVIEAVLALTNNLIICFFPSLRHYNFLFFTFSFSNFFKLEDKILGFSTKNEVSSICQYTLRLQANWIDKHTFHKKPNR